MAKDKASQKEQPVKAGFYNDSMKSPQAVPCGGLDSWLQRDLNVEMAQREAFNWPRAKTANQQMFQGGYTFCMDKSKKEEDL